jgi:hypothetical protein
LDYLGECDLILVDTKSFGDGLGMMVQARTTRNNYFSFIEKVAVKIGEDIWEFSNNVANVTSMGLLQLPNRAY